MTRAAAVDCGTNSIRLLIGEQNPDGTLTELTRQNTIVRLGEGVDKHGRFLPEAIERTRVALSSYVEDMERAGVTRVRMVATSATRDAANRDEFFAMTSELLGRIEPGKQAEVISGEEEATLSFQGATMDIDPARGPFCVIDLGGGSTEFVLGSGGQVDAAMSTQMGCVRISERFMVSDPPNDEEMDQARAYVRERIAEANAAVDLSRAATVVGCAGTFTTLSALAQGLPVYDAERIHMSELDFAAARRTTTMLRSQSNAQRAANPVISPGRADVIAAGAVIIEEIVNAAETFTDQKSVVISEKDLLDAILTTLL